MQPCSLSNCSFDSTSTTTAEPSYIDITVAISPAHFIDTSAAPSSESTSRSTPTATSVSVSSVSASSITSSSPSSCTLYTIQSTTPTTTTTPAAAPPRSCPALEERQQYQCSENSSYCTLKNTVTLFSIDTVTASSTISAGSSTAGAALSFPPYMTTSSNPSLSTSSRSACSSTDPESISTAHSAALPARIAADFDIVQHNIKDTLLIVSSLLSVMVQKNDSQYSPNVDPITLFHSRAVPKISIESYLARILQFIPFTNEVLLNVLVYLDRIGSLSGMEMVDGHRNSSSNSGNHGQEAAVQCLANASSSEVHTNRRCGSTSLTVSSSPMPATSASSSSQLSTVIPCLGSNHSSPLSKTTSPTSQFPPNSPFSARSKHLSPSSDAHERVCKISNPFLVSAQHPQVPKSSSDSIRGSSSDPPKIQKRGREEKETNPLELAEDANLKHPDQPVHVSNPDTIYLHNQQHEHEAQYPSDRLSKRPRLKPSLPSNVTNGSAIYVQCTSGVSTPVPMPRLSMAPNGFRINSFNIHRLLITCLMVAAKFTSDLFYSNARYAKVGGLSLLELNQLELEFLFTTRFELNVRVEELQRVGNALLRFKDREMVPRQQDQAQAQTLQQQQWQADRPGCQELQTANAHLCTAAASASTEGDSGGHRQQQTSGRFSIPSPTSPRNGPMSDRPTLTLISSSVSSSCSIASVSSTVAASSSSSSGSNGTTVVVVSGARLQRTQLLSPPEEKHSWAESEGVQMTQDLIHGPVEQDREASVSSAIQSFSSSSSSSSSS